MRFCIRKDFVHRKPVKGGENGTNVLPLFLTLSGVELLHFGLETRLSETKNITSYNSLSVMISTECKQTHRRSRCEGRITLFQMAQPSKIAEETRASAVVPLSNMMNHWLLKFPPAPGATYLSSCLVNMKNDYHCNALLFASLRCATKRRPFQLVHQTYKASSPFPL